MNSVVEETLKNIRHAVVFKDPKTIKKHIDTALLNVGRKGRREMVQEINRVIIETAIDNNNPEVLSALRGMSDDDTILLFSLLIQQYIKSHDEAWMKVIFSVTNELDRKSNQSRIFAEMAKRLIETGVTELNSELIQKGIQTLDRISFRKYRSEIMMDIIPLLNTWAVTKRDVDLLHQTLAFSQEIGDVAKRSVEITNVAYAMASVAISNQDISQYIESIKIAGSIKQKMRRQFCIASIIRNGAPTFLPTDYIDISTFVHFFKDQSEETLLEIISASLDEYFNRTQDTSQQTSSINSLIEKIPYSLHAIVRSLIKKAETDGDQRYLSQAIEFQHRYVNMTEYPIRDLVKAGISVASKTNDPTPLIKIVPLIEQSSNQFESSRLYLQLMEEMLVLGDIENALEIVGKIRDTTHNQQLYFECYTSLLKQSVLSNKVSLIKSFIEKKETDAIFLDMLSRAVIEISKHTSFQDIINHRDAITELAILHPQKDKIILEIINLLINRGFLDSADPDVLIRFTQSITDSLNREQALSTIVIKVAGLGVKTRNRDYLQRAVGLTCLIEEEKTRSSTLTAIIDEATGLAVQDGDLDLLRRMREWSTSLLSKDVEIHAMANIVNGMIKYAIDVRHPGALEEAYLIAKEIRDPSLQKELIENICIGSVQTGCLILQDPRFSSHTDELKPALHPFERSLELLHEHGKKEERSLKVAHLIDIVLDYTRRTNRIEYIIPLSMYVLEIEDPYERDAMVSRIVANMTQVRGSTDSTDPYETLVNYLQRIESLLKDPSMLDLIVQMMEQIKDPFTRLSKLANAAENYLRIDLTKKATELLGTIRSSLDLVKLHYQKVIILAYLTDYYAFFSQKRAQQSLSDALELLNYVEPDHASGTQRQLVTAMVRLHERHQEIKIFNDAVTIASRITDPVEYIGAMMTIYRMVRQDRKERKKILDLIAKKCDNVISPPQKASLLLDLSSLMVADNDNENAALILNQIADIFETIRIPFIADIYRTRLINICLTLFDRTHDDHIKQKAQDVALTIQHDDLQNQIQDPKNRIHFEPSPMVKKIRDLADKMVVDESHTENAGILERAIKSIPDNRKKAEYYADVVLLFRTHSRDQIAKKFLHFAIDEATKIRPLSRRAYVLCDMAMLLYEAGCDRAAQDLIDMAVDAATNIRQYSERDEVFEDLAFAMRFIREQYE